MAKKKKKALFNLPIYRRTDQQPMLSISGESKDDIFAVVDLEKEQHLGKKAGVQLLLSCRYDGKEFTLVHGDTHNLWLSHQSGDGKEVFEKFLGALEVNQHVTVEVLGVEILQEGKESAVAL